MIKKKNFSSMIYHLNINNIKEKNIDQYQHQSKIQKYQKYFIPTVKTNYYKKEGIIPGLIQNKLNKSKSIDNSSIISSYISCSINKDISHHPKQIMIL